MSRLVPEPPACPVESRASRKRPRGARRLRCGAVAALCAGFALLSGCGGGSGSGSSDSHQADGSPAPVGGGSSSPASGGASAPASSAGPTPSPLDDRGAQRLAAQASFGPNEALIAEIRGRGAAAWIAEQTTLSLSRYTSGNGSAVDQFTGSGSFCDQQKTSGDRCWRDWYSTEPLVWDFYRNAVTQPDQLRQRVAFALQQMLVVSGLEIGGTYGFRNYYNDLLAGALGNYRDVLRKVILSPVMGSFLNSANNDKDAPNENFAREMLQLFTIGTCSIGTDGALAGGRCTPTYGNDTVRSYAYALTGWTFPAGGATPWGCRPKGANCPYYDGDMQPLPALHDRQERPLLSGVTVPAGSSPADALERVLDSVMNHPNMAPFVGRQLIRHLVTSNPSTGYVSRVSAAFAAGRFTADGKSFGNGSRGDLTATVAAILLDADARDDSPSSDFGRLRDPVQFFASVLRALDGRTDGDALGSWWGEALRQHAFRPPSVFNFYPPDYPVPGNAKLVGPAFGIHNSDAALERLNFLTYLLMWGGSKPDRSVPDAVGTSVDLTAFETSADSAAGLVDRLSALAVGGALPSATRSQIVSAVGTLTADGDANWRADRVRQAAYLVFGSPDFQIQR